MLDAPPTLPDINFEPDRPQKRKFSLKVFYALLLFFISGLFIGRYILPAGEFNYKPLQFVAVKEGERQLIFPTFWEAWDALHSKFIGNLDDTNMYYGAVAGMVRAADDPYTVFAPPAETKQFEETIGGSFSGVGIEIGVRNGIVTVISPLAGSPADEAGVLASDAIIEIDSHPITQDMTIDEVVRQIRGERGDSVQLKVVHEGAQKPEEITITRDTIAIESVKLSIDDNIATIVITNFNGDTDKRFNSIAREIKKKKVKGIILDVRGNPGGFLDAAVEIASRFLDKNQLVLSEKGKTSKEYKAEGNNIIKDIPVVILVNGGSASASEILAGALHDQLNVPIIGTQTFGKGSVQEFMKLSDQSSLRVTIARWYTPSGRSIDEEGIEPTIIVEDNKDTPEDEQQLRAREEVNKLINQ